MSDKTTSWKELVGGRVLARSTKLGEGNPTIEVIVLEVSPSGELVKFKADMMPCALWDYAASLIFVELLPNYSELAIGLNCWKLCEALRASEGATVTLHCDNPDFGNGHDNCCVIVNGFWTNFEDKRYEGNSMLSALQHACDDMQQSIAKKPTKP